MEITNYVIPKVQRIDAARSMVHWARRYCKKNAILSAQLTRHFQAYLIGDEDDPCPKIQIEVRWDLVPGAVSLCDAERFSKLCKHFLNTMPHDKPGDDSMYDVIFNIFDKMILIARPPGTSYFWPSKTMQTDYSWERDVEVFKNRFIPLLLDVLRRDALIRQG